MMTRLGNPELDVARKNLKIAFALRNLTGAEVSRRAGMSRNGVGQFVEGRTLLCYENVMKVCDVLGLPIGIIHKKDAITENYIQNMNEVMSLPEYELRTLLDVRDALRRNKVLPD
jgi:transcriptional regulator with XRE-family HTH domain